MIRRPPRSTLFPTRRSSDLRLGVVWIGYDDNRAARLTGAGAAVPVWGEMMAALAPEPLALAKRSEEHTSELQSRLHLVCRLLLEKKKKTFSQQSSRTQV